MLNTKQAFAGGDVLVLDLQHDVRLFTGQAFVELHKLIDIDGSGVGPGLLVRVALGIVDLLPAVRLSPCGGAGSDPLRLRGHLRGGIGQVVEVVKHHRNA
ncbi:hypothetical protein SDC9_168086 [bioreactor metagenome]|uniref:Uncharacterized protein n=1 Tax=bioreactor metagenome TaxID=1076179 RepID=A0A645G1J2_9ZZZZ